MIIIRGRLFLRCNRCGRMHQVDMNTADMQCDSWTYERPMGPGVEYSFRWGIECQCGSVIDIRVDGSEYPIGSVEAQTPEIIGAEYTELPYLEVECESDEYDSYERTRSEAAIENIILSMSPREFEIFVGSIFVANGYDDVFVTQRTRDVAFDFEATEIRHGIKYSIIGECKHYSPSYKVGDEIIRKIHDAQYEKNANIAMVVTSSTFTRDAKERAREYRMTLWDIHDLVRYGGHLL